MRRHPHATARSIAATALAAAWLGLLVSSGGCEVAVGGAIPAFACEPGHDTCPANQVCNPATNHCQPNCTTAGCGPGSTCDQLSGTCTSTGNDSGAGPEVSVNDTGTADSSTPDTAPPPDTGVVVDTGTTDTSGPCPGAVGCACSGAASCTSDVCGDQESVTSGLYSAAGNANFCTQPCCTSADCAAGSVCFATAAGGNYCVLPQWVGRTDGIGAGQGGSSCTQGRECRSGVCSGNVCADTCCSGQATGECASGSACAFSAFPGSGIDVHYGANCSTTAGSGANGHSCSSNSSCASGICAADTMFGSNYCHGPCRSATDCGGTSGTCGGAPCACEYVLPNGNTDLVAVCVGSSGNTPEGGSCSAASDTCAAGFCDPNTSKCTSVCFTDADCTMAGWHCRPEQVTIYVNGQPGGSYSVLACGT